MRFSVYSLLLLFLACLFFSPSVHAASPVSGCVSDGGGFVCNGRSAGVSMAGAVADEQCVNQGSGYTCMDARHELRELLRPDDPYHGTLQYYMQLKYGNDPPFNRLPNVFVYYCADGTSWNGSICVPKDCTTEQPLGEQTFAFSADSSSPYEVCFQQCTFRAGPGIASIVDGVLYMTSEDWTATGAQCSADEGPVNVPADSDGDGSSDANDPAPNNPGQGGGGKDGKPTEDGGGLGDGNGSGEGSGNGNTSGGGGDCSSPPSSSGDAILAQIAYQTWATRCAIEGAKDGNGNLRTTDTGSSSGSGSGNGSGQGDGDHDQGSLNQGSQAEDDHGEEETGLHSLSPDFLGMLDQSGFIGGGTCPDFGSVTLGPFGTYSLGGQWFCDMLAYLRIAIIFFACFEAVRILLGER